MSSSSSVYTREELMGFAAAMAEGLKTSELREAIREAVLAEPLPTNSETVLERVEREQAKFLGREASKNQEAADEEAVLQVGSSLLKQLQEVTLRFPDDDAVESVITQLAESVEEVMNGLGAASPALAQMMSTEAQAAQHGQSHGGHSHGHGGGQCNHSHGGHGHGGPMGMGGPPPPLMMAAMNSLSDSQKATMFTVQSKMMRGEALTGEEQTQIAAIQRHIATFVQTMSQFMGGGGGAPAGPTGGNNNNRRK